MVILKQASIWDVDDVKIDWPSNLTSRKDANENITFLMGQMCRPISYLFEFTGITTYWIWNEVGRGSLGLRTRTGNGNIELRGEAGDEKLARQVTRILRSILKTIHKIVQACGFI